MPSSVPSSFPDLTEHPLSSERLLDGKLICVQRDRVRLPDGSESWREYVLHPGAVVIAAFVDADTLIFEHQYRYPVRRHFIELPAGNFELVAYKGLLLKDSYWRWPQRDLAGNAIDFYMKVLGLSFHDAMRQITEP